MVCINCGSETHVGNSRPQKRLNQVWRRRECATCGAVFTTEERVDYSGVWRVRASDGKLQPFNRDKLFMSLHKSLQHRPTALTDAAGLAGTITWKLAPSAVEGAIEASMIIQIATVALTRFDKVASTHYGAFHRQ